MSLAMTPQAKLKALENDWAKTARAALEHDDLAPCIVECERKRLERLEEAKRVDRNRPRL